MLLSIAVTVMGLVTWLGCPAIRLSMCQLCASWTVPVCRCVWCWCWCCETRNGGCSAAVPVIRGQSGAVGCDGRQRARAGRGLGLGAGGPYEKKSFFIYTNGRRLPLAPFPPHAQRRSLNWLARSPPLPSILWGPLPEKLNACTPRHQPPTLMASSVGHGSVVWPTPEASRRPFFVFCIGYPQETTSLGSLKHCAAVWASPSGHNTHSSVPQRHRRRLSTFWPDSE